jgi:CBS-domain-containing membrane protein
MRAIDVMARDVVTAAPETTVQGAAQLMINHRISGIPITDGDRRLLGIVTEGDLLRRVETGTERQHSPWSEWFSPNSRLAAEYIKSHARRVADVMTREVTSVDEFATLGEIADLMETKRIKRVPVVHDGKLVGIVSRADLLKVLASDGASPPDEERDRSIHSRLFAELRNQRWSRLNEPDIVVADGVVHLWGVVGSEEERRALRVAAENIPGVRGVEDHTISGPLRPGPLFPAA